MQALRTNARTPTGGGNKVGVCLEYSEKGKCPRPEGTCFFRHEKLSKKDNEELRERMKKARERKAAETGRAPPTCYTCGETGHISPVCPKKDKVRATVAVQSSTSHSNLREITQLMSDSQVDRFAHHLIAARAKESKGEAGE